MQKQAPAETISRQNKFLPKPFNAKIGSCQNYFLPK
jgi:hypothetical protein